MTVDLDGTPLDRCEDCGRFTADLLRHQCSRGGRSYTPLTRGRPGMAVAAVLCEFDTYDPDADVLHSPRRTHGRAYHRQADDPDAGPLDTECGRVVRGGNQWQTVERRVAKQRCRYPCADCHDIDLDRVEAELLKRGIIDEEDLA